MNKNKQLKQSNNKIFFDNGIQHGISSFKLNNFSNEVKVIIEKLYKECRNRLKCKTDTKKGIWITVESPKCCKNYAEFNVDRRVPMRQYFGRDNGEGVDGGIF